MVENDEQGAAVLLRAVGPRLGHAFVVGVTGPPGTGKSSLVDRLTESYRKKGLKVGIIAIDPTSPLTGGALLGDRIRMVDHTMDNGVFIRSMASRGWAGGLSGAVADVIQLLDAAGMDVVMVETVGIGPAEPGVGAGRAGGVGDCVVGPKSGTRREVMRLYDELFERGVDPLSDEFQQARKALEGHEQYLLQLWREA